MPEHTYKHTYTHAVHIHTHTCSTHSNIPSYIFSFPDKRNIDKVARIESDFRFQIAATSRAREIRAAPGKVRAIMRESVREEREHSLSFFMRADWETASSRETMTTRQPTLATNPAFSQSEPDRQLSKS